MSQPPSPIQWLDLIAPHPYRPEVGPYLHARGHSPEQRRARLKHQPGLWKRELEGLDGEHPAGVMRVARAQHMDAKVVTWANMNAVMLEVERPQDVPAGLHAARVRRLDEAGWGSLAACAHLLHLDLGGAGVEDKDVEGITTLAHLHTLILSKNPITAKGLAPLAKMTQLRQLDLSHTAITSAGLKSLAGLTLLESLSLQLTRVTDSGMKHLGALTHLETLDLAKTGVKNKGFAELESLPALHALNLWLSDVRAAGFEALARMPGLRALDLASTRADDAALAQLAGLERLSFLSLRFCTSIHPAGFAPLASLAALKHLDLGFTKISDEAIDKVCTLSELESLNVEGAGASGRADRPRLTDEGGVQLGALSQLRRLELGRREVGDETLEALSQLEHLEELHMYGCEVSPEGASHLGKMQALRSLTLFSTQKGEAYLEALAACSPLRTLHLTLHTSPEHHDKLISELSTLPDGLRSLTLSLLGHTVGTWAPLKHLKELVSLDIPLAAGGDASSLPFEELLQDFPALKGLSLADVEDADGALAAIDFPRDFRWLVVGRGASSEGLKHLSHCTEMKALVLAGCELSGETLEFLAQMDQLEQLDLQDTELGVKAFVQLARLRALRQLNVGGTDFDDLSLKQLSHMLALSDLNLSGTQVSSRGLAQLENHGHLRAIEGRAEGLKKGSSAAFAKKMPYLLGVYS